MGTWYFEPIEFTVTYEDPVEFWALCSIITGYGPPIAYTTLDGIGDN